MKRQNRQGGFTVVEIVVGLAVMGIFVLALTIMLTNLTAINDRARDLMLANGIAENKIESLRSADFVALSDGTFDFTSELPQTLTEPNSATYTVTAVNVAVKKIDINIQYTISGTPENLNYTSYIGELGVGQ